MISSENWGLWTQFLSMMWMNREPKLEVHEWFQGGGVGEGIGILHVFCTNDFLLFYEPFTTSLSDLNRAVKGAPDWRFVITTPQLNK